LGTARWRTTVDSVPHTNACAPKTTSVAIATAGDRGQRQRQVRAGLDEQADAHEVGQAEATLERNRTRPSR
jgi:hypothetical protein